MRGVLGFGGTARDLLTDLACDGGALLFIDNLDPLARGESQGLILAYVGDDDDITANAFNRTCDGGIIARPPECRRIDIATRQNLDAIKLIFQPLIPGCRGEQARVYLVWRRLRLRIHQTFCAIGQLIEFR